MDKSLGVVQEQYGEIKISDRKKISLTGIKKVVNFNPVEFLIESRLGVMLLKGSELEIVKLDVSEGILLLKGKFDSISYIDGNTKHKESFITRLFK